MIGVFTTGVCRKAYKRSHWVGLIVVFCLSFSTLWPNEDGTLHPRDSVAPMKDRLILEVAQNALDQGMPSVAIDGLLQALKSGNVSPELRSAYGELLVNAAIAADRYADAEVYMKTYLEPGSSSYWLQSAILNFYGGRYNESKLFMARIIKDRLDESYLPWFYVFKGLLADHQGELDRAMNYLSQAQEHCKYSNQLLQIKIIIERFNLLGKTENPKRVEALQNQLNTLTDLSARLETIRLLAIAFAQSGEKVKAISLLESALQTEGVKDNDYRDQFLLLLAYLANVDSEKRIEALKTLILEGKNTELQRMGLYLWSNGLKDEKAMVPLTLFLNDFLKDQQSHQLMDDVLLLRARIAYMKGDYEFADSLSTMLIEQYPGSPLRTDAIRFLAMLAWSRNPPQYRNAANYIDQLKREQKDPDIIARYNIMMGDCYFLNKDYERAAELYGIAYQGNGNARSAPRLYQWVLAEIKSGQLTEAGAHLDRYMEDFNGDSIYLWKAEWNLITALKMTGNIEAAFTRLETLLSMGLRNYPNALRLRFFWLDAALKLEKEQLDDVYKRCNQVIEILENTKDESLSSEFKEILGSEIQLLKIKAFIKENKESKALELLAQLRDQYPESKAAIQSYLVEARFLSGKGRLVEAQSLLISVADYYGDSAEAPLALWEAALNAEKRGIASTFQEAISILERLISSYPKHSLVFYARMKQADILRKLTEFGSAMLIYEKIINQYPQHPDRYSAEMSRADCLMAQAVQNPLRRKDAIAAYERLMDLTNASLDLRAEATFKLANALLKDDRPERAKLIFWKAVESYEHYLLSEPNETIRARYWVARSLFDLANLLRSEQSFAEAIRSYKLIIELELPGKLIAEREMKALML